MNATERKGRLSRISDLNLTLIEVDSRRRRPDLQEYLDRTKLDPYVVKTCLVAFGCTLILVLVVANGIWVASDYLAQPVIENPAASLAQGCRDRATVQENLWVLYHKQALIPGRSSVPGEGFWLRPAAWQRKADDAYHRVEILRNQAIELEGINQGIPSRPVRTR